MVFSEIEKKIGYTFTDKNLLKNALTHSSYLNEVRIKRGEHNERLEFLGDAVLELISSEYLYKNFPELKEGEMSKIRASAVCEKSLAVCAETIGLGEYMILGVGVEKEGGRKKPSITSDCFEAVLAAIYLDGGMKPAKEFVERFVLSNIEYDFALADAKSKLQEYFQGKNGKTIQYKLLSEEGPVHDRVYTMQAFLDGEPYETGEGHSKKEAEKAAAYNTIKKLKIQEETYVLKKH